ncbi:peptidyl-prolyl cis-trans isomerase FKBP2-like [Trichogramma pretiosum]|uniref:peptidyl-prolyl cis-trans isomerase FKBP2-like n=1 Tax=Trichogramma pretiosum TaxID=7493 RepID=UPI0006C96A85|nr:peptidyl-prolyl cis-trans isomerase FKBP2-like [Trichogramma pretiosum]
MRTSSTFICLALTFLCFGTLEGSSSSQKRLQIGIKRRVDNCIDKSKKGDTLFVTYVGALEDGSVFDKNEDRDDAFAVTIGTGQVIKGWEQGLIGMCVGEVRKLVIPPDLAYGKYGVPPTIPPDATLTFTVELVKLVPKEDLPQQSDAHYHEHL